MITKEKFKAYVEVQKEGLTNMFDIPVVMGLSKKFIDEGLTKEDCLDIMKNYKKYLGKDWMDKRLEAEDIIEGVESLEEAEEKLKNL